jgi:hypothetical protein
MSFRLPDSMGNHKVIGRPQAGKLDKMNHHDAEITDVIVVLDDAASREVDASVKLLASAGLNVSDVNKEEGVVEGSIAADKVHQLNAVQGVRYVRNVFTYTADYPTGDPRNCDPDDELCETDDD